MNCQMATRIGAMNHAVLCWTHSQLPYPAQRFFSVTNVPSIAVRPDRNVVFWSKDNPDFAQELEHNPPHVMIWAGMIRLSDWTLIFRETGEWVILFGNVGDVAHTSAERQRTPG